MKKHFFTGLIILMPLASTFFIIDFIVTFLTKPFMGLAYHLLKRYQILSKGFFIFSPDQILRYTSQLCILVVLFISILVLGILTRLFIINWMINFGEKLLHRLPIVKTIYKTTKEIVSNIFNQKKRSFQQVVLVNFPGHQIYAIGFLSEKAPKECAQKISEELISVFIPTSPNPATGFIIMYKQENIISLHMKPEEAIKYIVSCGIVVPQREGETE